MDNIREAVAVNLVGVESEVHAFFAGDIGESVRPKAACMLLAATGELHGCKRGPKARICPYGSVSCGAHEFLPCGARAYLDHGYVEFSTPACRATSEAVAAVRAGDQMIRNAAAKLEETFEKDVSVTAIRNNIDQRGHSFGAHVNLRMTRQGFELIFNDHDVLCGFIVPFFVSLPVICGSGRCSSEDGEDLFQIWQRGDFIETLLGEQTMFDRPLVNTRDESLSADPKRYARFHVISFDANRLEVAEFLKLGLLRLLCCAIDLGKVDVKLELSEPIEAVRSISRQPFRPIRLASNKTVTALEVQRAFLAAFCRLHEQDAFAGRVPDSFEILERWDQVLTKLEQDLYSLVGSLDWVTKYAWLEQIRSSKNLEWNSPQMKWLDLKYHCLTGDDAPNVPCEHVTTDRRIAEFTANAPPNSRAALRGEILRRFGDEIQANWHYIVSSREEIAYFLPDDPEPGLIEAMREAKTLKEAAASLGLTRVQPDREVTLEAQFIEIP